MTPLITVSVVGASMTFISEHCHNNCTKLLESRIIGQSLHLNDTLQICCLICAVLGCVLHSCAGPEGRNLQFWIKPANINDQHNQARCLLLIHWHPTFCHCPFTASGQSQHYRNIYRQQGQQRNSTLK